MLNVVAIMGRLAADPQLRQTTTGKNVASFRIACDRGRRDANGQIERLEKDKEISEDDQRRFETDIQKLTDRYVAEIDKVITEKEKEIMTV